MECKWAEEAEYRHLTQGSRDFSPRCRRRVLRQEFGETERCGPSRIQVKNHFHFQFDGMISSPRTVSNLHKNVPTSDLNNSGAQFFGRFTIALRFLRESMTVALETKIPFR